VLIPADPVESGVYRLRIIIHVISEA